MKTQVAMPIRNGLISRIADRYGVDADKMLNTLKATAFKQSGGEISNEQMMALLVVADQYKLNPFTRELFAFPDKGGIVPVVSIDGWARIVNEHEQFDGVRFQFDPDGTECTCFMFRRDRAHAIEVTEYMRECKRGTAPWNSHPRRMLRHKAYIQCARIAFGFAGIYDEDEATRILEKDVTPASETLANTRNLLKREPESVLDPAAPATATATVQVDEPFVLEASAPGLVESGVANDE